MKSRVLVAVLAILLALTAFDTVNALSAASSGGCGTPPPECPNNECSGPSNCVFRFGQFCCFSGGGPCDDDPC
ncbi:MAG: hypothetical protein ACREL7_02630 [Longimicrobiales bacterium]